MKFEITTLENGIRFVKIEGRMDIKGINVVGEEFAQSIGSHVTPVIIDLSGVIFIASLGMRTLLSTARGLNSKGGKVVLLNPQPFVREALVTAGIETLLPIFDNLDEASGALSV